MEFIFTLNDLQALVREQALPSGYGGRRDAAAYRKLFLTFGELAGFGRKELVLYANRYFPEHPVRGRGLVQAGLTEGRARYTA